MNDGLLPLLETNQACKDNGGAYGVVKFKGLCHDWGSAAVSKSGAYKSKGGPSAVWERNQAKANALFDRLENELGDAKSYLERMQQLVSTIIPQSALHKAAQDVRALQDQVFLGTSPFKFDGIFFPWRDVLKSRTVSKASRRQYWRSELRTEWVSGCVCVCAWGGAVRVQFRWGRASKSGGRTCRKICVTEGWWCKACKFFEVVVTGAGDARVFDSLPISLKGSMK